MYMDFIHDSCEVNFDLIEFTSADMRSWMTMVLASKQKPSKQKPDSDDNECIQIDSEKGREMKFSAKTKNIIMIKLESEK